ncbi:MAG: hypothetical protein ACRER6_06525, partial [Pseudomonas sp.]
MTVWKNTRCDASRTGFFFAWFFFRWTALSFFAGCPKNVGAKTFRTNSKGPEFCIQNSHTHKANYSMQCYRCHLTQVGDVRVLILKLLVIP